MFEEVMVRDFSPSSVRKVRQAQDRETWPHVRGPSEAAEVKGTVRVKIVERYI